MKSRFKLEEKDDRLEAIEVMDARTQALHRRRFLLGATAASLGALAISYAIPPAPAHAVVLTGHDEVFNVHDYGAVGDGVHADGPGIQAAITAASAVPGGATVYIPSGTYLVGATLTIATSHITVRGEGPSSLLMATFATGDILKIAYGGTTRIVGTALEEFSIYSSVLRTSGAAISFTYVQDVRIVSVQCAARDVAAAANNLWDGLVFKNFTAVYVQTAMLNVRNVGVTVSADASGIGADIWLAGGTIIQKADTGVHCGGGVGGLYFDEVICFNNLTHVTIDDSIAGIANREVIFNNCVLDTAANHGVQVLSNGVYVLSFHGTYGGNTGFGGKQGHPYGAIIRVFSGGILHPSNVVVSGCKFFNAYGDGILAESGSWSITGCDISLNGQGAAGGYGVYLSGSAVSNSLIVGNSIRQNGSYPTPLPIGVGVYVGSTVDNYIVTNNLLTDNGTADIQQTGGPHKVVANNLP